MSRPDLLPRVRHAPHLPPKGPGSSTVLKWLLAIAARIGDETQAVRVKHLSCWF